MVFATTCLCLTSCYDDPEFSSSNEEPSIINRYEGGVKQENPYTTENMKMAFDSIKAKVARNEYTLRSNQSQFRTNSLHFCRHRHVRG